MEEFELRKVSNRTLSRKLLDPLRTYSMRAIFAVFCAVFLCGLLCMDDKVSKTIWVVMFGVELGCCADTASHLHHCQKIGSFLYVCCW